MTDAPIPELLDETIFAAFREAVRAGDDAGVLRLMCEAAAQLDTLDPAISHEGYSASGAICVMVESVRVLTGETGTVARVQLPDFEDIAEENVRRRQWSKWANALEQMDIILGVGIGELANVLREEYAGPLLDKTQTERLLRVWKASKEFMFGWSRLELTFPDGEDYRFAPLSDVAYRHLDGLDTIAAYLFGIRENWSLDAKRAYRDCVIFLDENVDLGYSSPYYASGGDIYVIFPELDEPGVKQVT